MHRLALLVAIAACRYGGEFPCTQDSKCRFGEALSRCETAGFCSVPDDECMSGRRYDVTASDELAETCVPGPEGCELWMPRYFDACRIPAPSGNFSVTSGLTLDTTTGTVTDGADNVIPQPTFVIDQGGVPALVLSVEDFTVATGSILFVTGDRPLIIAAWGMANVAGSVIAGSSSTYGARGPGADLAPCTNVAPTTGADGSTSGGGGGGGGGFGGAGGGGGSGGTSAPGGAAGAAIAMPMIVHGGCSGATSGQAGSGFVAPATASSLATGGQGGGAVVIAARLAVTITGGVHAGGEGGAGAPIGSKSGGGGGGSGGLIALDAARVTVRGTLIASGGGGGGSAPASAAGDGGSDGGLNGANGGLATNCSMVGGSGSTATDATGDDGLSGTCGGSGGGGGAGYIFAFTPLFDAAGSMQNPSVIKDPF